MPRPLIALATVFSLFAMTLPTVAVAAPSNDAFANAAAISSLPFSDSVDNTAATTEIGENLGCGIEHTLWYSITPSASEAISLDMFGSSFFDTEIAVYRQTGSGIGGLNLINCQNFGPFVFTAQAGTTYYIQVGDRFTGGGTLVLNAHIIPPPPNDDFGSAKPVSSIPFSDTPDLSGATLQAGEPNPSCGFNPTPQSSVWYAFNPTQTGSYTVNTSTASFFPQVAAYTGTSLDSLTQVGCGTPATFHAVAGITYYIQLTNQVGSGGTIMINLDQTPPLQMNFFFSPSDPSSFDTVQFFDQSFDPGFLGINSMRWNLGDGTTATGCCPSHRYTTDGDYTVRLTDSTPDGRVGSTTQVVHVRTRDVSIAKLTVPQSVSAGQTRSITVGVSDNRYPESVEVQLFANDALVGTLTQSVPVRAAGRTTAFGFTYTFTDADAALGKVTFKAVASIVGGRDALPSDNTAVALPTRVNP